MTDDDPFQKLPSTLPAPSYGDGAEGVVAIPANVDPSTGLPIVNGRIDLSNGIALSDSERVGWQTTRALLLQAIHEHQAAPPNDPAAAATFAANLVATLAELMPFVRILRKPDGSHVIDETTQGLVLDVLAILQKALLLALPK